MLFIENRIDRNPVCGNPALGIMKPKIQFHFKEILVGEPLFAASQPLVSGSATGSAPGSAWERWEDRGHGRPPRPIVPEPSAYGAAMLALILAVVVWRRLASLRSVRGR
jgi:hypothetical protein